MAAQDIPDELAMFLKFDPYVVQVPDGYYTERIMLDEPLTAGPITEESAMPMQAIAYHTERCRIPRYRNEVRYGLEL